MSQMIGADVTALRQCGDQMKTSGLRLHQIVNETAAAVSRSSWAGADFIDFASMWDGQLRATLTSVGDNLVEASTSLLRQADQQELASAGDGGSGASGPGTPGPSSHGDAGGAQDCGACKYRGIPGAFNAAFSSQPWILGSAVLAGASLKVDSLLKEGAFVAGAKGGPGLWTLSKAGYPSQAPGWLDEATGVVYDSAKFGKTGQALNAFHAVARGASYLGIGAGLLSAYQAYSCGGPDAGYGVADGLISAGLSGMSLVPGPVGIVGTVLSIGWGAATLACGDKPVTKVITDGISSAWHSLFG